MFARPLARWRAPRAQPFLNQAGRVTRSFIKFSKSTDGSIPPVPPGAQVRVFALPGIIGALYRLAITYIIVYTFLEARRWKQHRQRAEEQARSTLLGDQMKQQELGLDSPVDRQF